VAMATMYQNPENRGATRKYSAQAAAPCCK
jgi:hypothetical protein